MGTEKNAQNGAYTDFKKSEKRKKRRKRLLISITAIVAVLVVVVALQWDRIQLLYFVATVDAQTAQIQAAESKEALENSLKSHEINDSIYSGDESEVDMEIAAVSAGVPAPSAEVNTSTVEDIEVNETEPNETGEVEQNVAGEKDTQADDEIQLKINELYALQDKFTGSINQIILGAYGEYMALPESERSSSVKISICLSKLPELNNLEKECDKQVDSIIKELTKLLKESGEDLILAEQARKSYEDQKSATIAELVNQIYSGGDGSGTSGQWIADNI